jgi:hypothetical protein
MPPMNHMRTAQPYVIFKGAKCLNTRNALVVECSHRAASRVVWGLLNALGRVAVGPIHAMRRLELWCWILVTRSNCERPLCRRPWCACISETVKNLPETAVVYNIAGVQACIDIPKVGIETKSGHRPKRMSLHRLRWKSRCSLIFSMFILASVSRILYTQSVDL